MANYRNRTHRDARPRVAANLTQAARERSPFAVHSPKHYLQSLESQVNLLRGTIEDLDDMAAWESVEDDLVNVSRTLSDVFDVLNAANQGGRRASVRRTAAKEKKDDRQSGQVSGKLRRRMGDALADLFDEFGPEIYSNTILSLKDVMLEKFREGFEQLDATIQEELGTRGVEESREHIRAWSDEIVEDVNHFGLDEVAGALEDYVGTLAAEFQQEAAEGDDLLEVPEEDLEEVEEVEEEDVEETDEDELQLDLEAPADDDLDLSDLGLELPDEEEAAANYGPLGGRRRRPAARQRRRVAQRDNWRNRVDRQLRRR
ncbi:hypothetical protein LCGC14_0905630 [marine sediment metagenome]|uniref:Uncharacterized protein n=1 Tax=marine sediment metagenome TaxID=412755 RepID=A0A0F9NZS9_9ZZZZ